MNQVQSISEETPKITTTASIVIEAGRARLRDVRSGVPVAVPSVRAASCREARCGSQRARRRDAQPPSSARLTSEPDQAEVGERLDQVAVRVGDGERARL